VQVQGTAPPLRSYLFHVFIVVFVTRLVLSQLEIAYNTLLTDVASDQMSSLVALNAFGQTKYTTTIAETIVLFCVCVITEIGNAKSNLIGVGHLVYQHGKWKCQKQPYWGRSF